MTLRLIDNVEDNNIPLCCINLFPASMDYNHVNKTELIYPREQDHVVFNITIIIVDTDDDETIEEFYLNVIPVENAVVLTPRITVEIGCCKKAYNYENDVITYCY